VRLTYVQLQAVVLDQEGSSRLESPPIHRRMEQFASRYAKKAKRCEPKAEPTHFRIYQGQFAFASSASARATFVSTAVQLLEDNGLDGSVLFLWMMLRLCKSRRTNSPYILALTSTGSIRLRPRPRTTSCSFRNSESHSLHMPRRKVRAIGF
jgi:hypothetical protein